MTVATPDPASLDAGRAVLLVTGAPGAGKSTVSAILADALTRSALIDEFFVSTLVRSGRVWALGEPRDEAARQVDLSHRNTCALAGNLADAGFTPIIDTVVPDGAQLQTFRRLLGPRLRLVVLDPGTEECIRRNAARPPAEQFFFDDYDALHASMRRDFGHAGWWVDTARQTAAETARLALAHAGDRGVVPDEGGR